MCKFKYIPVLILALTFTVHNSKAGNFPLPLGIVFDQGTPEVQTAFKHALLTFTLNITSNPRDLYRFTAYVDTINTADAFKLSKLICNQFSRGIFAMVGSMNAESFHTYHAFANTFHMPLITPWYPSKDTISPYKVKAQNNGGKEVEDYATRLRPDFNPAILDTIHHYGWKEVIYLYSSNDGLLRLQTLFYRPSDTDYSLRVKLVKKISTAKDAIAVLRDIESAERFSHKYVLLDCPTSLAKEIIIGHVNDVHLGRRTYHYLIAGLAFDEIWEKDILEFNAVNITGFRMVDPNRRYVQEFLVTWASLDINQFPGAGTDSISANVAFMHDAMLIIKEAFTDILVDNPYSLKRYSAESACDSGSDFLDDVRPFEYGQTVNQHLRRVQTEGLTGNIQFHENGTRKYFTVDVIELRENATKFKIGQWSDFAGFRMDSSNKQASQSQSTQNQEKNVYVISTNLEEPYLRLKKQNPKTKLTGNEMYEGFIKDLADTLFTTMGLQYRIQIVRDGKYGSKVATSYGETWNGIIGELIRQEADLSIAPLTITAERERVVEFTMPFLSQGVAIMTYKPRKPQPGMFSFMNPLSDLVWLSVIGSYFAVSIVLYVIFRLTTAHQRQVRQQEPSTSSGGDYVSNVSKYNGKKPANGQAFVQNSSVVIEPKPQRSQATVSNFLWMSFSILSHSRSAAISRSIAARFASTVWWLFALILVSVYTGNYMALRMKNKVSSPIRSAWDLAEHAGAGGIQYGILESGSTYEFFKKSENQVYQAMFEHISGPNQQNMKTYDDGINMVRQKKGKYAFIMESAKIDYVSNKRPCNTMKVGPDLSDVHYGIALPVGSRMTQKFNLEILKLKEAGVLVQLEQKWWKNNLECQIASKLDQMESTISEDELSLGNLVGVFYILIGGMVIAILVTFLELFFSPSKESRNSKSTSEAMVQRHTTSLMDSHAVPTDFCDIPTDLTSK